MKKLFNSEILINSKDHKNKNDWRAIFRFLDNNLNYQQLNGFLDLACGLGNLGYLIFKRNPKCRVVCSDIKQDYLKSISLRQPEIETLRHDINQPLPFEANSFDLVSCVGTLHYTYIQKPKDVLAEMRRVSKKYILVDFFSNYSPWAWLERIFYPNYNPRRYTKTQILNLAKQLGLEPIAMVGTRAILPTAFAFWGKTTLFLFKKK